MVLNEKLSISVVIPTTGNVKYLKRAIESVLVQDYPINEIIVVVDGYSEEVALLCQNFKSGKIKVFQNGSKKGGSYTRNYGIQKSTSQWIALLDDDDEWYTDKLSKQVEAVLEHIDLYPYIFSFTKVLVKSEKKDYFLPRKKFDCQGSVSDYLFVPLLGRNQGFIQTSTFLAPKDLLLQIPFTDGLEKHQDWDLVLNLDKRGVKFVYVDEPLGIYYQGNTNSVGTANKWRVSLAWIKSQKKNISAKAYASFLISPILENLIRDETLTRQELYLNFFEISNNIDYKFKLSVKYIYQIILLCKKLIS